MHQNKPVAPITYLNHKGEKVTVSESDTDSLETPLNLNLKELAILQTCLNRSYFNCNCDLNKEVLGQILSKTKEALRLHSEISKEEDSK
jgi:hypothetical protein